MKTYQNGFVSDVEMLGDAMAAFSAGEWRGGEFRFQQF